MKKYHPLKDCPICGSSSGKCRSTEDNGKEFILCMGLPDEDWGTKINSYKCLTKDSGKYSWAGSTWVEDNTAEWSEERRKEWEEQRRQRQEQQARENEERRRLSLSAVERNREYTAIFAELGLHPDGSADLQRRGFSPQEIERSGFKSVSRYQKLKSPADPRLPGVSADGKFLTVAGDGYLCPIRDVDGLIVACQIRLRNPSDGNRYRWLSSKNAVLALPNGELPLAVFWPDGKPKGISLAEGTGAKPFLVSQRRGEICIGSAGGQWTASPATLKGTLEKLASEIESRIITIYPDAGDTLNSSVILRWKRTIQLLEELGWGVNIGWWNQVDKSRCDVDELSDFGQIQLIAAEKFSWEVGAVGVVEGEISQSLPDTRIDRVWQMWRKARGFTADKIIEEQFIKDKIQIPEKGTATFVNSGLGTGKTAWLYQVIQARKDEGFVALGYRNNLLTQFCEEAGFYHYQQDLKGQAELELILKDPNSRVCSCIDSILHYADEDFEGKTLIFDEVESTIQQLLTGDTAVARWREQAKEKFVKALQKSSRAIFLDGNLTDNTVDYISGLCDKKVVKIRNTFKGNCANTVAFHLGSVGIEEKINRNDRSVFLQYLFEQGIEQGAFAVGSDSQIFVEALDNILKDMGLHGYRLDSTTCNESWLKEFLNGQDGPKNFIEKHKPDYFLYSPSAESGINVDIKGYFKNLYFSFFGVIQTNQQLQMIRRIRDTEAVIHVFCKPVGIAEHHLSNSPFPDEIDKAFREYRIDCGMASLEGMDFAESLNQFIAKLVNLSADSHYKRECELKALANHERANLRECLKEALITSGYRVIEHTKLADPKAIERVKEAEKEVKELISESTFNAPDISTEQANDLISSKGGKLTRDEKCRVWRRRLLDRLPGIEEAKGESGEAIFTPEFIRKVHFEDRNLISSIENFYFLNHPEVAQRLQQDKWFWELSEATGEQPKPLKLSGYRSRWLKVKSLLELGIDRFWQEGKEWHSESPEVLEIYKALQAPKVARNTGVALGKESPAALVGKILKGFGFTTTSTRPKKEDGSQSRIYRIADSPLNDPIKAAIYQSVGQRVEGRIAELEQQNWEKISLQISGIEGVSKPDEVSVSAAPHPASISYIKRAGCGAEFLKAKEEEDEQLCSSTEEAEFTPLASQLLSLTQEDGSVPCEARFWEVAAPYLATPGDREVFEDAIYELGLNRGWRLLKLWRDGRQQQAATEGLQPIADTLQPILEPTVLQGFELAYAVKRGKEILGHIGKRSGTKALWWAVGLVGRLFPTEHDAAAALAMAC